jgi:hypothetical protein
VTIAYESEGGGAAGNFGIGTRSGVTSSLIENCQVQLFEPADAIYTSGSGVELRNVDIIAEGWDAGASPSTVIGGSTPRLENVTLNGSSY